ncbi:MAG: SafA/ExsA family spore coat assembly protein [Oscillospiraceae bacterium]
MFSLLCAVSISFASAASTYTVKSGDSMWKIAVKYQVGVSEIISANPQIKNPNLIYPGDVLQIPAVDTSVRSYETEVIRLVNEIRVDNKLKPLTENWELSRIARYKAQDMHDNGYFDHNSPVYGSPFTMIKNFGLTYRAAAENIAMGYRTPQTVVKGWMNSTTGHRENILNPSYTQIGVGYCADGNYCSQMFIG